MAALCKLEDAPAFAERVCTVTFSVVGKLDRKRVVAALGSGKRIELLALPSAKEKPRVGAGAGAGVGAGATDATVFRGDSFDAAEWALAGGARRPLVLDFASDSVPGGGWRGKQRGTQEESLCRRSSLGLTLERQHYPFGDNQGIYVADVVVWARPDFTPLPTPLWCSVLAASLRPTDDSPRERERMVAKMCGVLQTALAHGHDAVILGAWGCGAFGGSANTVARAFETALGRVGGGLRAIFAVPSGDNLVAFRAVFE